MYNKDTEEAQSTFGVALLVVVLQHFVAEHEVALLPPLFEGSFGCGQQVQFKVIIAINS
jgi:hypothetical protein